MSLITRVRHHLPYGLCRKPILSSMVALNPSHLNVLSRHFSQPARKEEEEEEEVEIDQRRLPADYDPTTFDPTEHRSPPTDRVFRLVDEIAGLTLVEVAELSSILMKKMGMKEPPIVGVMKPGVAGLAGMAMKAPTAAKEEKKLEKTVFELKLESYDAASKIKVIKEIRSFTDLGLKEAKDLVEKTPTVFKKGVSKEEGDPLLLFLLLSFFFRFSLLGFRILSLHFSYSSSQPTLMAEEVQNGGAEHQVSKAVTFSAMKPQLFVEAPKANDAVEFYKAAFGAQEVNRTMHPKRKAEQELPLVLSAELKLGSSSILVSDLADDSSAPVKTLGAGFVMCLETENVEAAVAKAVSAGAASEGEVVEGDGACCGGRVGKVKDPYGNIWLICSPAKKCAEVEA